MYKADCPIVIIETAALDCARYELQNIGQDRTQRFGRQFRRRLSWRGIQGHFCARLQFALAYAPVSTTLVGMSKVRHVARNLEGLNVPLDDSLLKQVLDILEPVANICWQEGIQENFDPGAVAQYRCSSNQATYSA